MMTDPTYPNEPEYSTGSLYSKPLPSQLLQDLAGTEVRGVAEGQGPGEDLQRAQAPRPRDPEFVGPRRNRIQRRIPRAQIRTHKCFTARERLLILDTWIRSKLPAKDFAGLVGLSQHSLYKWRQRFADEGPAGLEDRAKGPKQGSRLSDETQRAILLMKQSHPEWGQDRLCAMLNRTKGLGASPGAIARYLEEQGYEVESIPTKPHPDKPRRFERSKPNQLWQTDLFTFVLKRQNRRVHLVGFMDDHSRFLVGYGLHASSSGALVREVLESAIANHGAPEEILTDNGAQYYTWRGKSAFSKLLERRGIKQIVARPRHPQTLGKIERFWGTLWRECIQQAVFRDLNDARQRIGLFIDHYNFQRTHSGIDGLVPADRFFAAAPQVLETLRQRVAANAKELAQQGMPRKNFYLTGRVGNENISLHAEGERVVLTKADGQREEVDLGASGRRDDRADQVLPDPVSAEGKPPDHPGTTDNQGDAPGTSPLDQALRDLSEGFAEGEDA